MGNDSLEENYPKKQQQPYSMFKLKMLAFVLLTNLITFYIFAGPSINLDTISKYTKNFSIPPLCNSQELNTTQHELNATRFQVIALSRQLETLLNELHQVKLDQSVPSKSLSLESVYADMSEEARLAIGPHKLPFGFTPRSGSDEIYPSVGASCLKYHDDLAQYMRYDIGGECPVDDVFVQRLMLKGCEPLPRRRCHPKSPHGYIEPSPLSTSLWTTPPDTSIIWDPYTCKSYKCLAERTHKPGFFDCKDCFVLDGREKTRWLHDGGLDYGIDRVLEMKPRGTIRIGLDIGGGSGTFAARMKEKDVTIITTSMNLDGPFNSFISSRGLLSMHLSISQRLPFFENTLDIVHSMHVMSNWIPDKMLEFALYDIYRVLRPGGLFWLDRFFCFGSQLNVTYVPMIDRVGFKRLRWDTGMKLDRGVAMNEWYFSALLEKPMT